MSGFDSRWLALREPADTAARDAQLVGQLADYLAQQGATTLIDIGCGTGSTWRNLTSHVPADTHWQLLDHDPALLREAERRIGTRDTVIYRQFDLNQVDALMLPTHAVVTASALFDLASETFCAALIERLAAKRCVLYAALNYDGIMHWSKAHPLDEAMLAVFNRHQQSEKELGKALGPAATGCLEKHLRAKGYHVDVRPSPWQLDADSDELQAEFIAGLRRPLLEMADKPRGEIEDWLAFRLSMIRQPGSLCTVGHTDLIAFPEDLTATGS